MGAFDFLKILNKPQSVLDGALMGFARQFPGLMGKGDDIEGETRRSNQEHVRNLQAQGFDTSQIEDELNLNKPGGNINSILGGISAGWKEDLAPSTLHREAIRKDTGSYDDGLANKGIGTLADVVLDPLNAGVGLLGASGKLGKAGEAATTVGKLGEEAGKGEKLAQFGRRFQQGMSATGEPMTAAGTALMSGFAERKLAARARAISQMLEKTPGNIADVAKAEDVISPASHLVGPEDIASISNNTGVGSALDDLPVTPRMPPDATPGLEDELMKLLQPKKPKVLIDPLIDDQDIVSQILNNTGRRRG